MLARSIHAFEGLFVKQAHQTEAAGEHGHLLHGEEVLVDGLVGVREDGCDLVLRGRYFVVLRAHGDAEFPQLIVESLQEVVYGRADGAEVVLFELLGPCRGNGRRACAQ